MAVAPHIRKRMAEEAAAAAIAAAGNHTCSAGHPSTIMTATEPPLDTPDLGASAPRFNTSSAVSPMSVGVPQRTALASSAGAGSVGHSRPWEATRAQITANAPAKVLCSACKTVRRAADFSPKQLAHIVEELARNPYFNAAKWPRINCADCNRDIVELECSNCEVTKPKAAYNQTQWRLRREGTAICNVCCQEKRDAELQDLQDEDVPQSSESEDDEEGGAPLAAIESEESDFSKSDGSDYDSDDSMYKLKL